MSRPVAIFGFVLAAQLFMAAPAAACEANCQCGHKNKAQATDETAEGAAKPSKKDEAAPARTDDKAVPHRAPAPAKGEKAPADVKAGLNQAAPHLAEKCSCSSTSDCTCKKGQCKCGACGRGHRKARVFDSLGAPVSPAPSPSKAQRDAAGGLFI